MKRIVAIAILVVASAVGGRLTAPVQFPCQYEDEVLVGQGQFTHGQGWDRLVCIPADDVTVAS